VRRDGQPSNALIGRTRAAFEAGGQAATYMPTGAVGRYGPSEASIMGQLLMRWGVPQEQILLEETGHDTLSSARACARLLHGRTEPVRVATSGYHLPRCLVLLRLAGVRARACPAPPPASRWRHRWYWRLREGLALPFDIVLSLLG
jgi:vancomycin permeability regulator SanA